MRFPILAPFLATVLAVGAAACGGSPRGSPSASTGSAGSTPSPVSSAATTFAASPFDPEAGPLEAACGGPVSHDTHHAPELERQLPHEVGGRHLSVWSVRGRCALELLFGGTGVDVDDVLADVNRDRDAPIDLDEVAQGIAGREDVARHPPYLVYAAARPTDADAIDLNLLVLFGGGGFHDVAGAAALEDFERQMIDGREVFVGSEDMLEQSDHQRGRPYLYQTDDTMFLVITDDEAWAEEAISKLP